MTTITKSQNSTAPYRMEEEKTPSQQVTTVNDLSSKIPSAKGESRDLTKREVIALTSIAFATFGAGAYIAALGTVFVKGILLTLSATLLGVSGAALLVYGLPALIISVLIGVGCYYTMRSEEAPVPEEVVLEYYSSEELSPEQKAQRYRFKSPRTEWTLDVEKVPNMDRHDNTEVPPRVRTDEELQSILVAKEAQKQSWNAYYSDNPSPALQAKDSKTRVTFAGLNDVQEANKTELAALDEKYKKPGLTPREFKRLQELEQRLQNQREQRGFYLTETETDQRALDGGVYFCHKEVIRLKSRLEGLSAVFSWELTPEETAEKSRLKLWLKNIDYTQKKG